MFWVSGFVYFLRSLNKVFWSNLNSILYTPIKNVSKESSGVTKIVHLKLYLNYFHKTTVSVDQPTISL